MAGDKLEDAVRAARLYYFQDRTMDAIAQELHTSRSTVSRLLTFAREQGYVEFRLHDPHEAAPLLERDIAERFEVRAYVVPGTTEGGELAVLERVAQYAARVLNTCFDSDMILGVAWGTTVTAVSRQLVPKPTRNAWVVQLNGAGNQETTGIDYASEILRRFGEAFRARVVQFPVPTFFEYGDTKTALWREQSVHRILDLQHRADVAVFGVGSFAGPIPSHLYRSGYLSEQDLARLRADGVVGDVATVFLRGDGSSDGIDLNTRSSAPDPAELCQVAERLCIVADASRVEGLRAALAAGLVTRVVVDEQTAVALVADHRTRS